MNNDGLHGMRTRSGSYTLKKGYASISIYYFERGGGAGLYVHWKGPGFKKKPLGGSKVTQRKQKSKSKRKGRLIKAVKKPMTKLRKKAKKLTKKASTLTRKAKKESKKAKKAAKKGRPRKAKREKKKARKLKRKARKDKKKAKKDKKKAKKLKRKKPPSSKKRKAQKRGKKAAKIMTKGGKCKCPSVNSLMREIYAYRMKCKSVRGGARASSGKGKGKRKGKRKGKTKGKKGREELSLIQTDSSKVITKSKLSDLEKVIRLRKENALLKDKLVEMQNAQATRRKLELNKVDDKLTELSS